MTKAAKPKRSKVVWRYEDATYQAIAKLTEAVVELGVRLAALEQQIGKSRT